MAGWVSSVNSIVCFPFTSTGWFTNITRQVTFPALSRSSCIVEPAASQSQPSELSQNQVNPRSPLPNQNQGMKWPYASSRLDLVLSHTTHRESPV